MSDLYEFQGQTPYYQQSQDVQHAPDCDCARCQDGDAEDWGTGPLDCESPQIDADLEALEDAAWADAFNAQFDDDPSPYDGNYSEE